MKLNVRICSLEGEIVYLKFEFILKEWIAEIIINNLNTQTLTHGIPIN